MQKSKCRKAPFLWSPAVGGREGRDELQTKVPLTPKLNSLQTGMAVRHRVDPIGGHVAQGLQTKVLRRSFRV